MKEWSLQTIKSSLSVTKLSFQLKYGQVFASVFFWVAKLAFSIRVNTYSDPEQRKKLIHTLVANQAKVMFDMSKQA